MNSVQGQQVFKAGVIGHPVTHSKSSLIHGYWLKKYGIIGEYKAYEIAPNNLRDEVFRLRDAGLKGFNVTVPHKTTMLEICTTLTKEARDMGAVNTVVFYADGEIEGRNTDAYGFLENLKHAQPDFNFRHAAVAIIGAGGAARAIVYALQSRGVADIRIFNRTIEKAETLADDFHIKVYEDIQSAARGANLIVNTTSLGMMGQPALDLDLREVGSEAIIYDIVYVPLMTPLLQQAQSLGLKTVTGIGMLLHQARPAFQAFFGVLAKIDDELQNLVLK